MHGVNIESATSENPSPEGQSNLHDRALILSYAALSPTNCSGASHCWQRL